jgi:hypothetical protein
VSGGNIKANQIKRAPAFAKEIENGGLSAHNFFLMLDALRGMVENFVTSYQKMQNST